MLCNDNTWCEECLDFRGVLIRLKRPKYVVRIIVGFLIDRPDQRLNAANENAGPSRLLLLLQYAAPVWANTLEKKVNRRKMGPAFTLTALRTCCAFRTISDEVTCIIAAIIRIGILVIEGQRLYGRAYLTRETSAQRRQFARSETMAEWQERCNESAKIRWTTESYETFGGGWSNYIGK